MAEQIRKYEHELFQTDDLVKISEERVRLEFGRDLAQIGQTGKRAIYRVFREFLTDPSRPGAFAFRNVRDDRHKPRHIAVYISDPAVRFEFKMRWA